MCDHHADCIDLDGKYDCKCHIGYAENGFECINIDECVTSTFLCTTNSGEIFRVSFYGRLHIGVFRYIRNQKNHKNSKNARIWKLPIRVFAQKDIGWSHIRVKHLVTDLHTLE